MMTAIRQFAAGTLLALAYGIQWLAQRIEPQRGGGPGEERATVQRGGGSGEE